MGEQQLAQMRAMYALNEEKLNYNEKVLRRREKQSIASVDHLKRREKKLKELVVSAKERFIANNASKKLKIKSIADEYNRVSAQYKELQAKFKHFEVSDLAKYEQICSMNRDEAMQVLSQIQKCDAIICAQLLGCDCDTKWLVTTNNVASETQTTTSDETLKMASSHHKYSSEQILKVCKTIIGEAPFLIPNQMKNSAMDIQCDAIFKSLGVEDLEDMEALCNLFLNQTFAPHQTVEKIKEFVSQRNAESGKTANIQTSNYSVKHKQERRKRKDAEYWHLLQTIFPSVNRKTWSLLEQYLQKYIAVLEKRKGEAIKILNLQNENGQLRELLKQYLASDANKELLIPPSLVLL